MKKASKTFRHPSGISQVTSSFEQSGKSFSRTANFTFEKDPGKVYVEVRAISARVNRNFDGFRSAELKKAYTSFIGRPVFVNHVNHDHTRTRGVVKDSKYLENGDDKYISLLIEVDAVNFPKLAAELERGDLDSVSMGCDVTASTCSYCGNVAREVNDFCDHVMYHKGEVLDHPEKGPTLVYEDCEGLNFFEISFVFDPADETALAERIISTASKRALRDTIAPPEVDTLREESICPQCGDENFDGQTCEFCGHTAPMDELDDPDVDVAREVDIRQDMEEQSYATDPRKEGPSTMPNTALSRALAARNVAAAKRRLHALDDSVMDEDLTPVPASESPTSTTEQKRNEETSTNVEDTDEAVLTDVSPDKKEKVTSRRRREAARRRKARRTKRAATVVNPDNYGNVYALDWIPGNYSRDYDLIEVDDKWLAHVALDGNFYLLDAQDQYDADEEARDILSDIEDDMANGRLARRRKARRKVANETFVAPDGSVIEAVATDTGYTIYVDGNLVDKVSYSEFDGSDAHNDEWLPAAKWYALTRMSRRVARRHMAEVPRTDEQARNEADSVDVEKPVSNVNDTEGQESQFDVSDFEGNQSKDKAKKDDSNTTVVPGKAARRKSASNVGDEVVLLADPTDPEDSDAIYTFDGKRWTSSNPYHGEAYSDSVIQGYLSEGLAVTARRRKTAKRRWFLDNDYRVWVEDANGSWVHNDGNGNSTTMSDADAQDLIQSEGLTIKDNDIDPRQARRKTAKRWFLDGSLVWVQNEDGSWTHNDGNGNVATMSDSEAQSLIQANGLVVNDQDNLDRRARHKDAHVKTATLTQVIALLDAYEALNLIPEGQRYNVTAEFERLPAATANDRLALLTKVREANKRQAKQASAAPRNRGMVPTASKTRNMPAMGQSAPSTKVAQSSTQADDYMILL